MKQVKTFTMKNENFQKLVIIADHISKKLCLNVSLSSALGHVINEFYNSIDKNESKSQ